MFFAFLVKNTSGILFFGPSFRKPARKASSGYAFRAGLRKLGPKNNIPEVFLTRKAKNICNYVYTGGCSYIFGTNFGFHILNLHPKRYIFKKYPFLMPIY